MTTIGFRYFIEALMFPMGMVLAVGLIHIAILEFEHIHQLFNGSSGKKNNWKNFLIPLIPRLRYLIGGLAISAFSYSIVTVIYGQFPEYHLNRVPLNFLASEYYQTLGFVLSIAFFVLCGYALAISAGNRWLINLSKIFAVVAVLILLIATIGIYIPTP